MHVFMSPHEYDWKTPFAFAESAGWTDDKPTRLFVMSPHLVQAKRQSAQKTVGAELRFSAVDLGFGS